MKILPIETPACTERLVAKDVSIVSMLFESLKSGLSKSTKTECGASG